jgi:hypothetical protein
VCVCVRLGRQVALREYVHVRELEKKPLSAPRCRGGSFVDEASFASSGLHNLHLVLNEE